MRSIITLVICVIVLAFTFPASALFGLPQTLEGNIQNISQETIVVMSKKGSSQEIMEIQINNETQLKEVASLNQLEEGDKVKVRYTEEGGQKIAVTIIKVVQESLQASTDSKS